MHDPAVPATNHSSSRRRPLLAAAAATDEHEDEHREGAGREDHRRPEQGPPARVDEPADDPRPRAGTDQVPGVRVAGPGAQEAEQAEGHAAAAGDGRRRHREDGDEADAEGRRPANVRPAALHRGDDGRQAQPGEDEWQGRRLRAGARNGREGQEHHAPPSPALPQHADDARPEPDGEDRPEHLRRAQVGHRVEREATSGAEGRAESRGEPDGDGTEDARPPRAGHLTRERRGGDHEREDDGAEPGAQEQRGRVGPGQVDGRGEVRVHEPVVVQQVPGHLRVAQGRGPERLVHEGQVEQHVRVVREAGCGSPGQRLRGVGPVEREDAEDPGPEDAGGRPERGRGPGAR